MANTDIKVILSADDRTKSGFASAQRNLDKLKTGAANVSRAFSTLGVGIGVGAFAAIAKNSIDAADGLNDLSSRTGVAVKDLASLELAARLSDTSLDAVGKAIQRLNLSVGQAQSSKEIARALADLGVSSGDARERLFQLADAYKASGGQGKVLADIQKVLGKSYTDLIPLLEQGGEGMRELALGQESYAETMARLAPDAAKFNDQLDALRVNAAGASAAILTKLVPSLNEAFDRIRLVKDLIGAGGLFNTLVSTTGASDIEDVMRRVRREIELTQDAIEGKRSRGLDASAFEEKLRGLNAQLEVLIENRVKAIQAPIRATGTANTGTIDFKSTLSKPTRSDPLAGLLSGTDIGKLREFDKQVALLNQRFNFGKKDAELYAQAMTKLVETAFADSFKQAADDQEFLNMVMQDGQETINLANQNMRDWQETLKETQRDLIDLADPVNALIRQLTELDKFDGLIDPEVLAGARLAINEQIDGQDKSKDKIKELDNFAKTAAENIQNSFADFLFNPFENGLKGMAQSFGQLIQRMIAEAVAADLAKKLFGGLVEGGSGSGVAGGLLTGLGGLLGFANGGIMTSSGAMPLKRYASGGVASMPQLALFGEGSMNEAFVPLPDGRSIPVKMQGGAPSIVVNINGMNNAPDILSAGGQVARQISGIMKVAGRYG